MLVEVQKQNREFKDLSHLLIMHIHQQYRAITHRNR